MITIKTDTKLRDVIEDTEFMPAIIRAKGMYPRYVGENVAETVRRLFGICPDITMAGVINFFMQSCGSAETRDSAFQLLIGAKAAIERAIVAEMAINAPVDGYPAVAPEIAEAPCTHTFSTSHLQSTGVSSSSPATSGHSVAPGIGEGTRPGSGIPSSPRSRQQELLAKLHAHKK